MPCTNIPVLRHLECNSHSNETSEAKKEKKLVIDLMRWGLIPSYTKNQAEAKQGYSMINARSESIDTKNVFRRLVNRRRCVVPVDGFYEWHSTTDALGNSKKKPYFIFRSSKQHDEANKSQEALNLSSCGYSLPGPIMFLAGLWDEW
jgi:putative SOS response-associated peptidase YedK